MVRFQNLIWVWHCLCLASRRMAGCKVCVYLCIKQDIKTEQSAEGGNKSGVKSDQTRASSS